MKLKEFGPWGGASKISLCRSAIDMSNTEISLNEIIICIIFGQSFETETYDKFYVQFCFKYLLFLWFIDNVQGTVSLLTLIK